VDSELRQAQGLLRRGQVAQAEAVLRAILVRRPDDADALYTLGSAAAARGDRIEALRRVGAAVERRPGEAVFHTTLGNLLVREERIDEAIAAFRTAIALKPDGYQAHNNLGAALRRAGDLRGAVNCWRTATALKRGSPWYRPVGLPPPTPKTADLPTFTTSAAYKLRHDVEQLRYLRDQGSLGPDFDPTLAAFEAALAEMGDSAAIGPLDLGRHPLLRAAYNRLVRWRETPALAAGALAPDLPVAEIEARYAVSGPGIVHVDGLLRPEALAALRQFCLESTVWFDFRHDHGYLGAYLNERFDADLLLQVADELIERFPGVFRGRRLRHLWAYKYDSAMDGIGIHADEAAVNVNFWLTPDQANRDPTHGGLVVWDAEAPRSWDFQRFNNDVPSIERFLRESGARPVVVPHRQNRAVIFNSDLFHATDTIRFAEGYENRRLNVTLLFGDRHDGL
jgi:tetratricopeptide (TPR) repeat protein